MSEQEFKSYRLVSLSEPSDEMLAMLMDKAAKEVRKNNLRTKKACLRWQQEQGKL